MPHFLPDLPLQRMKLPRGMLGFSGSFHFFQVVMEADLDDISCSAAILDGLRLSHVFAPPGFQDRRAVLPRAVELPSDLQVHPAPLHAVLDLVGQPSHLRGAREAPFGLHERQWAEQEAAALGLDLHPGGADALAAAARRCACHREALVLILLARDCDLRQFNACVTQPWTSPSIHHHRPVRRAPPADPPGPRRHPLG